MNVYEALGEIQHRLKAPKNQTNKFGGYNYRSAEDILEAVKPLAHEVGATVNCSDEVLMVGGRFYVVATAILTTYEGEQVAVQGWAREQDERKGMDASQVTGSASSYARKYALSGLFAIDDEKDADAQEPEQPKRKKAKKPDELAQAKRDLMDAVKEYAERMGLDSKAIAGGIAERPDYQENKENAEWYRLVTEEFSNG